MIIQLAIIQVKSFADCWAHPTSYSMAVLMIMISEVACLNPHGGTIIVSFILWFMQSQYIFFITESRVRSTFNYTERHAKKTNRNLRWHSLSVAIKHPAQDRFQPMYLVISTNSIDKSAI
jgi:hypothetical protein